MRNRRKQSSNGGREGGKEGGDNPPTAGSSHIRDSLVPLLYFLVENMFPFIGKYLTADRSQVFVVSLININYIII